MPNHAFIAILTEWQIQGDIGKKWLSILRETGFEFIRTVNNSVYSGPNLGSPTDTANSNDNHIFALIRNIGESALKDPFTPPKAWADLPKVKVESHECLFTDEDEAVSSLDEESAIFSGIDLAADQHKADTEIWNRLGPAKLLTEAEAEKAAPGALWYAGVRDKYPQQLKSARLKATGADTKAAPLSPFGVAVAQNG